MKEFYYSYFDAKSNDIYINLQKGFSSYFLSFDSGTRLELMQKTNLCKWKNDFNNIVGLTHLAVSVGNENKVDRLTSRLQDDGYTVISNPRRTGDGYYESIILDPDGNRVEIMT